jgi:hypothetical protein
MSTKVLQAMASAENEGVPRISLRSSGLRSLQVSCTPRIDALVAQRIALRSHPVVRQEGASKLFVGRFVSKIV